MFRNYTERLPVGSIMRKNYIRLLPNASIFDCSYAMLKNRRDEAIIVENLDHPDTKENVIGILTKSDIAAHLDKSRLDMPIGDIVNRSLTVIEPTISAREARNIMLQNKIGRLIVKEDGIISGILTVTELLNTFYLQVDEIESTLTSILENVREAICFIDSTGTVIFWNKSSEELYKVPKERILNRHIGDIFPTALLLKSLQDRKAYKNMKHSPVKGVSTIISTTPILIDGEFIGVVSTDKDESEVTNLSNELERQRSQLRLLEDRVKTMSDDKNAFSNVIGNCQKILSAINLSKYVAKTSANILITGESGTGKEVFANAIHTESGRKGTFVPINCSAIPSNLLESELFGYEAGSFTGALKTGRAGKFEQARGGTLFLDEIGDMPLEMQAKLLRVLQDGVVTRIGGAKAMSFDVRIICATNRDLKDLMTQGEFREDLFYRINVMTVELPPLRERREDIPLLVMEFMKEFSVKNNLGSVKISQDAMDVLTQYKWKGNIRELRNTIERLVILCQTGTIEKADLSPEILRTELPAKINFEAIGHQFDLEETIAEFEKNSIISALAIAKGSRSKAAELLNLNRTSIYYKIKQYGIDV